MILKQKPKKIRNNAFMNIPKIDLFTNRIFMHLAVTVQPECNVGRRTPVREFF